MKTFKQLKEELNLGEGLSDQMGSELAAKFGAKIRTGKQTHKPGVDPTKPQVGSTVIPSRKTFNSPGSKID